MKNQFEPIFFTPPSGDTKRKRTLYKGGGGGDGGAAERKAKEDARIATAINGLNQVFGMTNAAPEAVDKAAYTTQVRVGRGTKSVFNQAAYDAAVAAAKAKADQLNSAATARENLYSKIGDDTKNNAMIDLNKERGLTERDLNFTLARNGLSGGSRDVDANKDVLDTFNQGVLKATNMGLQTSNDARSSDEKTRVNLINSIHAGLTDGDAQQQAYQGMANNAKLAQDNANSASLVGFFDALNNQIQRSQYQNSVNSAITPINNNQKQDIPYSNAVTSGGSNGTLRKA